MTDAVDERPLRKIRSDQLRPGMYLHKLCGSWMSHPFWRTSFVIRDAEQIAVIIDSGILEVWIDVERGDPVTEDGEPAPAGEPVLDVVIETATEPDPADDDDPSMLVPEPTRLHDELAVARRICSAAKPVVQAMFKEARLGALADTGAAWELVDEIAASVLRNPSALISVARLKNADDYTYLHSVAVSGLMMALGRQLGLDDTATRQSAIGGLLHDMGKARIPLDLLNKPGSLSEPEFAVIRTHPVHGYKLLLDSGIDDTEVLDVVLHHHERVDGTGYPHGLAGDAIGRLARMSAICDVYDAVTSDRPYKAGWDPGQAIHRMHAWKGHFDATLLQNFVRVIGIYPVGALIRLESDKLGVVVEQGASLLKPTVRAFYSTRANKQIPVHDIDLAATGCQDRIVGTEHPAAWGLKNLDRLWMP